MNQKELNTHLVYLRRAKILSEKSNCKRRKIGAVLVKDKDHSWARHNRASLGCTECTRTTLHECPATHAEVSVVNAAGHSSVYSHDLYVFAEIPCLQCLTYINDNSGVKNIYCLKPESYATYYPAVLDPWRLDQIDLRRTYAKRLGLNVIELELPANF